jgi:hypothetical protein
MVQLKMLVNWQLKEVASQILAIGKHVSHGSRNYRCLREACPQIDTSLAHRLPHSVTVMNQHWKTKRNDVMWQFIIQRSEALSFRQVL